jgi:hypothetical protein
LRRCTVILLPVLLLSCVRPPQNVAPAPDPAARLQAIPAASSEKYRKMTNMREWKNPTLLVREDGIGLLDLANNEIHILKPEEVPNALADLPASSWPYGRVVVIQLNGVVSGTEEGKARLRRNRALLIGTLESLKVAINEVPSA